MKKKLQTKNRTLADKVDRMMRGPTHPEHRKIMFEGVMLSLPLAFAFMWYSYLIFSSTPIAGATAKFAPSRIESLVLFILLFIMSYSVFLIYEIKHMKIKWEHVRKK